MLYMSSVPRASALTLLSDPGCEIVSFAEASSDHSKGEKDYNKGKQATKETERKSPYTHNTE